jgi:predicted O-methyltransferase YrrM
VPGTKPSHDFATTWAHATTFPGWLTDDQARALWEHGRQVPEGGQVVEIGSHQAKSTAVLAAVLRGRSVRLTAVDPHEKDFGPGHEVARRGFEDNLASLGLRDEVELVEELSHELLPTWDRPIDLLYIDGAHDYRSVVRDLGWLRWVRHGGVVLVHDAFSSVGVTLAFLTHVVAGGRLRYVTRAQSMAVFRLERPRVRDRVAMLAQLPWFVRNVLIKVAMVSRRHGLARRLGHTQGTDFPY